ncbi:hypothetical protein [Microbacterium petrolearium]
MNFVASDWSGLQVETKVALFAAGVALVVGILSPIVNAFNTWATLRAQRQLANDDRVWAKRAEVYEALLEWSSSRIDQLALTHPSRKNQSPDGIDAPDGCGIDPESFGLPRNLDIRARAYANPNIREVAILFDREFRVHVRDRRDLPRTGDYDGANRSGRIANRIYDHLAVMISYDLEVRPRGRPEWRRDLIDRWDSIWNREDGWLIRSYRIVTGLGRGKSRAWGDT